LHLLTKLVADVILSLILYTKTNSIFLTAVVFYLLVVGSVRGANIKALTKRIDYVYELLGKRYTWLEQDFTQHVELHHTDLVDVNGYDFQQTVSED